MPDKAPALVDLSPAVAGEANQTRPGASKTGRFWRFTHRTLSSARGLWSGATDPRDRRYVSHRDGILWASSWVACRVSQGGTSKAKGTRQVWKPRSEGYAVPPNRLRHNANLDSQWQRILLGRGAAE